jgi:hypothetical protein
MVLGAFRKTSEMGRFTNEELQHALNRARGTTFNLIRELRNHGLLDRDGDGWIVPETVMETMSRGRLGEHIRQQLLKNGLVADLISHLHSDGYISVAGIPEFLQKAFPFVAASAATWSNYANLLLKWLTEVRLVVKPACTLGFIRRALVASRSRNIPRSCSFPRRGSGSR